MAMTSADLEFHAFCLTRTGTRLDQFARAIRSRVTKDDVVVDLGAGTGILSFLACAAGARRVYAIEAGDALSFGQQLAAHNGWSDRIVFIGQASTQVVLPEQADVIVGDIHDTFGLQQNGLTAFIDARDRLLKPGGGLIPCAIDLFVAPVDDELLYEKSVETWHQRVQGIDLLPLRQLAVNQPTPARFDAAQLVAAPAHLASIDLLLAHSRHVGGTSTVRAARHGAIHGICGCFETTLSNDIVIGNVPGKSDTTNFAQAFFPIERPVQVETGDEISVRMDVHDGIEARWQVDITREGRQLGRFDHSTLRSAALSLGKLRRQAADYCPTLTERGTAERALLDRFDGKHAAQELDAWLVEQFKGTFPSPNEATAFLKAAIERYG